MNKWVNSVLASPTRKAIPVMTSPGIELINGKPRDVFRDGTLQFRCIKALCDNTPSDGAVTIMDLSVEAEAFGCPVEFSDLENPNITDRLLFSADDIDTMRIPAVGEKRTSVCLEAAKLCAENITDRPTFGGLIGPFSLAGRLFDMTEIMMLAAMEPEQADALLDKCTRFLIEYAKAFKAAGVAGLIMAEPAAGLLSPDMANDFAYKYIARIVEAVKDDDFTFVLHNCGNTVKQIDGMVATGADAIHVGNAVNLADIVPQVPDNVLVMGNIDPVGVFKSGTPAMMKAAVENLMTQFGDRKNYVISSGCDVPPGTPMSNVYAFYGAVAEFQKN